MKLAIVPAAWVLGALMTAASAASSSTYINYDRIADVPFRPPSDCAQYYRSACANWRLGPWLPTLGDTFEPWRKGEAKETAFEDGFVYEGRTQHYRTSTFYDPADGTGFTYGMAGPPKGAAVYDYEHHLAFYSQGCCDWRAFVEAQGVRPPPLRVVDRNLTSLRTRRGIALGQSIAQVEAVYGPNRLRPLPGHADIRMLYYHHPFDRSCGQVQNFGFRNGVLIYIELTEAC